MLRYDVVVNALGNETNTINFVVEGIVNALKILDDEFGFEIDVLGVMFASKHMYYVLASAITVRGPEDSAHYGKILREQQGMERWA